MIATAELVKWLRAPEGDADIAAEVASLERAAVAAAERRGGFYYGPAATLTQVADWSGGPIQLRAVPVGDVTVERWAGTGWEGVAPTGFYTHDALLYMVSPPYSRESVRHRLSYQGGYAVDATDPLVWDAPEDVKQAVRMLVAHWYNNRESVVVGTISTAVELAFNSLIETRATV